MLHEHIYSKNRNFQSYQFLHSQQFTKLLLPLCGVLHELESILTYQNASVVFHRLKKKLASEGLSNSLCVTRGGHQRAASWINWKRLNIFNSSTFSGVSPCSCQETASKLALWDVHSSLDLQKLYFPLLTSAELQGQLSMGTFPHLFQSLSLTWCTANMKFKLCNLRFSIFPA